MAAKSPKCGGFGYGLCCPFRWVTATAEEAKHCINPAGLGRDAPSPTTDAHGHGGLVHLSRPNNSPTTLALPPPSKPYLLPSVLAACLLRPGRSAAMEEGGFDYWNWSVPLATPRGPAAADGSSLPPPPLSGDSWAGSSIPLPAASPPLIITADRSWSLDDIEDLSMLGGDIFATGTNGSLALEAADWSMFGPQWIDGDGDGLPDHGGGAGEESQDPLPLLGLDSLDSLLDLDGSWSGSGANQASVDSQLQAAGADHPWGMDSLLPMAPPAVSNALLLEQTQVGAGDSPPAAPATGPNQAVIDEMSPVLPEDEMADVTMTLADMIRIAEECGKDEAASTVWSAEEHNDLLYGLRRYANHDRAPSCFNISTYLTKKTALDVALRCRWLQDKEKTAKQAELAQNDSAGVLKVNKGQGTKGARKSENMYPLSKEALDSKSTRELLRDSYIFMQQIEENIKTGKLGEETADYFYFVRTIMDAIGKRENEFCRMSMPVPPIDEQGLEEILQQSRHSSSAGKEAKCCPCERRRNKPPPAVR